MSAIRPDWARLFRIAGSLIRQVNSEQLIIDSWSFGGGTAMMLQVGHRESHDVDIFVPDAQLLSFLDPKLHDFELEIRPSDYGGDGTGFLKLAFEDGTLPRGYRNHEAKSPLETSWLPNTLRKHRSDQFASRLMMSETF